MKLDIIQSYGEVQLCGGWCSWNDCNQAKWICLNCGYVECERCSEDYEELISTDEQEGWGLTFCRKCGLTITDEFPDAWHNKETLELEYDEDGDLRIARSEWSDYFSINATVPDDATIGTTAFGGNL